MLSWAKIHVTVFVAWLPITAHGASFVVGVSFVTMTGHVCTIDSPLHFGPPHLQRGEQQELETKGRAWTDPTGGWPGPVLVCDPPPPQPPPPPGFER